MIEQTKFYVDKLTFTSLEVKKSKFISFLFPFNIFSDQMEKIKKQHPKARHHVYAYRHLNNSDQIVENQSDNGEPKGSSGKPTLTVMRGNHLINCAIITTRYFGGTKLGVGGLVRAYSDSANLVIKNSQLLPYKKMTSILLHIPFTHLNKVFHIMDKFRINCIQKSFESDCAKIKVGIAEDDKENLLQLIDIYLKK